MSVALGEIDGYISLGESSWDVVAALAILAQLGGESTIDWRAKDLLASLPSLAARPNSCWSPQQRLG